MNDHLLQLKLTTAQYQIIAEQVRSWVEPEAYINKLPAYLIASCPFCLDKNVERLDTYSIRNWRTGVGESLFDHRAITHHCWHFALVQPFFHFHGNWPKEARGMLGPEVPHVIGHLLELNHSKAVIHALPICEIENNSFVPKYTLYMVSYFSQQPNEAYQAVIRFNAEYVEPGVAWSFIAPPDGCDHWWDLNHWVEKEQLFWVDANDPELGIRTGDVASFPYGNIEGRTWPYLHTFPYPLPKPKKKKPS